MQRLSRRTLGAEQKLPRQQLQETKRWRSRRSSVYSQGNGIAVASAQFVLVLLRMFASGPAHGEQDLANPSGELSNWDFLQDLDFVPEKFLASVPQGTAPDFSASTSTKEKNRQAQKRFRQRKKVHALPVFRDLWP